MITFRTYIPEEALQSLTTRVDAFNRSASLLGCLASTMAETGQTREVRARDQLGHARDLLLVEVELEVPDPRYGESVAVGVRASSGDVEVFLGQSVPSTLRDRPVVCEHCGDAQPRERVYLFRDCDQRVVQVAAECVTTWVGPQRDDTLAVLDHSARLSHALDGLALDSEADPSKQKAEATEFPTVPWYTRPLQTLLFAVPVIVGITVWLTAPSLSNPEAPRMSAARKSERALGPSRRDLAWLSPGGGGGGSAASMSPELAAQINLASSLRDFGRSPTQPLRNRVVESFVERIDEMKPSLLAILAEEHHPLILEAIAVSGRAGLTEAGPLLSKLARSTRPAVRAAAVRAGGMLNAWWSEEVEAFLSDPESKVVAATLGALAGRGHQSASSVIPMLGHPDRTVRLAAVAAFPMDAGETDILSLCQFARTCSGAEARRAAALALGEPIPTLPSEVCLLELLQDDVAAVRDAALRSMAKHVARPKATAPEREAVHQVLLALAANEERAMRERAMALIALERRRDVPVRGVKRLAPRLHPALQALAARCLVVAGDRDGVALAIGLLDAAKLRGEHDVDEINFAIAEARALLVELADEDFGPERDAWIRWFDGTEYFGRGALRRQAEAFW
ncbi:MAG: hypothetical protein AAF628_16690 [Planctomycetota bacterium]